MEGVKKWKGDRAEKIPDPWETFGKSSDSSRLRRPIKKRFKMQKTTMSGNKASAVGEATEDEGSYYCAIHSFTIDSQELGWTNWLFGPRMFRSSYCSGSCQDPAIKPHEDMNGSTTQQEQCDFHHKNKTTIINLSNALRADTEGRLKGERYLKHWNSRSSFPNNSRSASKGKTSINSCCGPKLFAPISLLYIDENEDVVLKSFTRINALSCDCLAG